MREIATVLGKLDDVVDTEIPKDLVWLSSFRVKPPANYTFTAYHLHGEVQRRLPLPGRLSSSGYDECPRRMALQEGS